MTYSSKEFEVRGAYGEKPAFIQSWSDEPSRSDEDTIRIDRWRSPASAYPRRRCGATAVRTAWYRPNTYACYMQRGYEFYEATKRLYVTTLQIAGSTWMVDDPPHWWAMKDHALRYHGHVLCAGLGLGLIVHALNENPFVEKITVVEREADVINLIGPLVPQEKLEIIHEDFYAVKPSDIDHVDGVLFDLLVGEGPLLIDAAVSCMAEVLKAWPHANPVRVHGIPNSLIEPQARALCGLSA